MIPTHWCPVKVSIQISKSRIIRMKKIFLHATHLNFVECHLLVRSDAFWTLYSFAGFGFDRSQNFGKVGHTFQYQLARSALRSAPAVDLHGLRSIDLARRSSRYRRMPQRQTRSALPLGFSGTRCQIHSGRCQRKSGLEAVGGFSFELDPKNQKSLRRRRFGTGFGTHHLRAGLDDDRFVADDVPVGDIPLDQERNQGSHPDRFEGTDSGLRIRVPGQHARCEVVGHVGVRIRGDLSFRQGLHRLWQTPAHCGLGSVFRNTREGQPAFRAARVWSCGQNNGASERSGRVFGAAQSEGKLSVSVEADSVFRRRAKALSGVFDQPHGTSRPVGCQTLQKALGDRVVFQVDQGQSADQALLWDESQRGENADLDRCDDIPADSHPAQGVEIARKPPQNSADFKRSSVREDCFA